MDISKGKYWDESWNPDGRFKPLEWGKPRVVAVNWLGDLFCSSIEWGSVDIIFESMRHADRHQFLVLTKRPNLMREYVYGGIRAGWQPIENVWLGATVWDQTSYDDAMYWMQNLKDAGWKTWLSIEPMLGAVSFRWASWEPIKRHAPTNHLAGLRRLDQVVLGGESGHGARPMHPDWARGVRDQCKEAQVPFFFKQWGEWAPDDQVESMAVYGRKNANAAITEMNGKVFYKVGKCHAGRTLDGRTHDELAWEVA